MQDRELCCQHRQIRKIPGRYEVGDFAYSGCTGRGLTCLVDEAAGEGGKFVDAAVAEKRPPAAHILAALHVDVDKVDAFALSVGTEKQFALRTGYEGAAPEENAVGLSAGVGFVTHAVDGDDG